MGENKIIGAIHDFLSMLNKPPNYTEGKKMLRLCGALDLWQWCTVFVRGILVKF